MGRVILKNMFIEIGKYLAEQNISVTLCFHSETKQYYWDLNTQAKSDLHLYEDLTLKGRYGYISKLENETLEENIQSLCWEFKDCLHGRDYGSCAWFELCKKKQFD